MTQTNALLGLLILTLATTIYVAYALPTAFDEARPTARVLIKENNTLNAEVAQLRREVKLLTAQLDGRLSRIERSIERSKRALDETQVRSNSKDSPEVHKEASDAIAAAVAKRFEGKLEEQFQRMKAAAAERNAHGQWKAPMSELVEQLQLDKETALATSEAFNASKDDALALLLRERSDGTSLIDELVSDYRKGIANPEKRLFERIVSQQVPGENRTYLAAFEEITETLREDLQEQLSENQMNKLDRLNIALLEVGTDHDPVGDYIRDQLFR